MDDAEAKQTKTNPTAEAKDAPGTMRSGSMSSEGKETSTSDQPAELESYRSVERTDVVEEEDDNDNNNYNSDVVVDDDDDNGDVVVEEEEEEEGEGEEEQEDEEGEEVSAPRTPPEPEAAATRAVRRRRWRRRPGALHVGPHAPLTTLTRQGNTSLPTDPRDYGHSVDAEAYAPGDLSHVVATLVEEPPIVPATRIVEPSADDVLSQSPREEEEDVDGNGFLDEEDPTAEDSSAETRRCGTRWDKRFIIYTVLSLLAVAAIATAVALAVVLSSSRDSAEDDGSGGITDPLESSTTTTTSPLTSATTEAATTSLPTSTEVSRSAQITDFIVSSVSGEAALDPNTPQGSALRWVLDDDLLHLGTEESGNLDDSSVQVRKLVQRYVLMVLYYALNGEGWANSEGFATGVDECDGWHGVECTNGSVAVISMVNNVMVGQLPSEIGILKGLQTISLYRNSIGGTLPKSLTTLPELERIDFYHNHLTGTIMPEFGNMTSLQHAILRWNHLKGQLPSQLGLLTQLETMSFGNNDLNTTIPETFHNLKSLRYFDLHSANVRGTIPTSLGLLSKLERFDLSSGSLTGTIPTEILGLSKLVNLGIGNNQLTGTISSAIGELRNLESLRLQRNQLSGTIPETLGYLTKLKTLQLHQNSFTGSMPQEICAIDIDVLSSDCDNTTLAREIECSCCTECCEDVEKAVVMLGRLC